ncbi:metallophosphoesterase family protein [Chloroflexota bacterium]
MKIGVISDIHSDGAALEKALHRLDTIHQVQHILCAGDLVGRGPDPGSVLALVRSRKIPVVQGNHDEWAYDLIDDDLEYLQNLPLDWRGEFAGCNVFMTHGKPGNNMWGLYEEHISPDVVDLMLASLGAHVLITGHTHQPMCLRGRHSVIINPGSLYTFASRRPSTHTYGVLDVPSTTFALYDLLGSPDEVISL